MRIDLKAAAPNRDSCREKDGPDFIIESDRWSVKRANVLKIWHFVRSRRQDVKLIDKAGHNAGLLTRNDLDRAHIGENPGRNL